MNNPQHTTKNTYSVTEHWEVWETNVKKLKQYMLAMSDNDRNYDSNKDLNKKEKV